MGLNRYENFHEGSIEIGVYDWPWHWSWIWVPIGMGLLACRLLLTAVGPADGLETVHEAEEEGV